MWLSARYTDNTRFLCLSPFHQVYLSLIPVIAGVALASASEVSFSMISLVSGLLSNVCFALRAISAKKLMNKPVRASAFLQSATNRRERSRERQRGTKLCARGVVW